MKARHGLSRRSFLTRVVGGVAIGGALTLVAGEALAFQVTDSDSGARGDPAGRGRGRTGESDGDPTDPAGYGRPRTGCSDGDSGTQRRSRRPRALPHRESDSDPTDAGGHGRPRTGITDGDSGPGADAAGRGRGRGECNDRDRGPTGDPPAAAGAACAARIRAPMLS